MGRKIHIGEKPCREGLARRRFIKMAGATAAGLLMGCHGRPKAQATLALVNGTMIDGTGAHAVSNGALLLGGDRILAAGPLPRIKIPAGVATIDVQGGTIFPGFINAHVHTAYNETLLKTWAQSGVTTVRDLGLLFTIRTNYYGVRLYVP